MRLCPRQLFYCHALTRITLMTLIRAFVLLLIFAFFACTPAKKSSSNASTPSMQLRLNIANAAEDYLGTPYKYAGQKPSSGFDCSGFTSYVLRQYKVKLSPASAEQAKQGRSVPVDNVQPADLIFFGENNKKISHVALVVTRSKKGIVCIHSTTSRGVIMENISTSSYWKPKILFARDVVSK